MALKTYESTAITKNILLNTVHTSIAHIFFETPYWLAWTKVYNAHFYWREIEEQFRQIGFWWSHRKRKRDRQRDFNLESFRNGFKSYLKSQYTRPIFGDGYNVRKQPFPIKKTSKKSVGIFSSTGVSRIGKIKIFRYDEWCGQDISI